MFSNNAYAKVWQVTEKPTQNGNTSKQIRISTSRKQEDGSYLQDFGGFVRLVGDAKNKPVQENDRIQLLSVGVTNNYDKEKNITYTNFTCFDFKTQAELNAERGDNGGNYASTNTNSATSTPSTPVDNGGFMNIPDGIEDELPFN